jgi:hypothetical protein
VWCDHDEVSSRSTPVTSRRGDAEPAYRIRPATLEDTGFLADVVLTATRAQGRVPGDFNGADKDNPRARRLCERLGCVQVAEDEEEHKLRWRP